MPFSSSERHVGNWSYGWEADSTWIVEGSRGTCTLASPRQEELKGEIEDGEMTQLFWWRELNIKSKMKETEWKFTPKEVEGVVFYTLVSVHHLTRHTSTASSVLVTISEHSHMACTLYLKTKDWRGYVEKSALARRESETALRFLLSNFLVKCTSEN